MDEETDTNEVEVQQQEEEDNNENEVVEEQEEEIEQEEITEDNEEVVGEEQEEEVEEGNENEEDVEETVEDENIEEQEQENVETLAEEGEPEAEDDCMIIESNDNATTNNNNNKPASSTSSNIAKIEPIVRKEQEGIKTEDSTVTAEENQNVILAKPDVFIFKIPLYNRLRKNLAEFKSSEWDLSNYWNGSFKVIADESCCLLQFFDEENKLYGQSSVENFPGEKMHKVKDSSRYFVLKLQMQGKEEELVGFGFSDRSDSADLIKTLKTYFEVHAVIHTRRAATSQLSHPPSKKPKVEESKKHDFIMDQSSPLASQLKHFPSKSNINILPLEFVKKGLEVPGKFACDLCNASFDDMRHIKSHWHKIHDILHPCHCVVCQLPFVSPTEMKAHRLKYHGFRCPDCPDKSFKKAKSLENHYFSTHQKKLGYPCSFPSICKVIFSSTDELKSHLLIHHKNEDLSRILFPCNEKGCKEQCFTHEALVGHQLTHINNMVCEFCNESMKTKGALRKHLQANHPGATVTRI